MAITPGEWWPLSFALRFGPRLFVRGLLGRGLGWKLCSRAFYSLGSRRAAQHWSTNGGAPIRFCVLDLHNRYLFQKTLVLVRRTSEWWRSHSWVWGKGKTEGYVRRWLHSANGRLRPGPDSGACGSFHVKHQMSIPRLPPSGGPDSERPALENQEDDRKTSCRSPAPRETGRILQRHFSSLPCHTQTRIPAASSDNSCTSSGPTGPARRPRWPTRSITITRASWTYHAPTLPIPSRSLCTGNRPDPVKGFT